MNTSAAKVNVLGGHHGFTTYSIARKSSVVRVLHGKHTMAHVHVAVEYPEIMEALTRKQSDEGDELREGLIMLNEKHKVSVVIYQKNVNGATLIHFQDSY